MKLQPLAAMVIFLVWAAGIFTVQLVLVGESLTRRKWPPLLFWKKWDVLHICPMFTFFSRLPGVHYRLMVRDLYEGARQDLTPWRMIVLPPHPLYRCLWNPGRRVSFAVEDACRSLLAHLGNQVGQSDEVNYECFAYRFFHYYCAQLPGFPGAVQRQFMLVQERTMPAAGPPEPLFLSPFFAVDATGAQGVYAVSRPASNAMRDLMQAQESGHAG